MSKRILRAAPFAILALAIPAIGLWVENPYHLQIFTFIGLNTLLALGLNLLMGYAGQISLGHAAFFGIGAYTTGVMTATFGLSPWLALPCAVFLAVLVAFAVGLPTLRLSGYYLGMGTLGFGMIGFVVFREWTGLTGGASGLVGIPPLEIGPISFSSPRNGFYLVWGAALAAFLVCRRLVESRTGRALRAIHDSERAARAVGVDTLRLKLTIFVFSAGMAALTGFLYAHLVGFVSPGTFDFLASVRMVTMVVVGGMASIWGALLGAALLTLLPEWLHAFSEWEMVVYGLIMMTVMILLPRGLTRGLLDLYERARNRGRRDAAPAAD
jgi:branched-chain amino acid transport system permease protein